MATARVYLIGSPESPLVKIGWSDNPERRLRDLQTGSPVPLQLLALFEGGAVIEAALHRQLADKRRHGEWFDLGADPVAVVSPLAKVAQVKEEERAGHRQPVHDLHPHYASIEEWSVWMPDVPPRVYERVEQECPTWKEAGQCLCDS
ncbi:GIY-YIG nuclease family protein [Streptomyces sp. NPDC048473]|uniref:GIY-YIG nuclease family protein n=1 Tax=Streptomyces sp. NPDC048473 TaxID=3365556 RepID=UPI00371DA67F